MSTYIDTSTSVGLVLSGTPQNPVTIGSSGTIAVGSTATAHSGDAIYGSSITAWTVSNYGTVKAAAAASTGIDLVAGGTVTNAVGALIAGAANGIRLAGSADFVSNSGVINGTGTSGAGVYLAAGGRVSNLLGGVITGTQDGVVVAGGATATVSNLGTITAGGTVGIVDGVYIGAGTVVNGNSTTKSALISSTLYGVVVAGTTGAVSNFGTVRGTGTAGVGIYLQNRGSVSNALGALISGGHAGILMKGAGAVSNLGTIAGTATATAGYVDGVYMNAGTVVNGATNVTTALISGVKYGVVMYGSATSTVRNFGTIASTAAADPISKPAGILMKAAGVVVNGATNARQALISGDYHGIFINGSSATTVTNFGTVQGIGASGDGIDVSADAGVSVVSNSGTVNGIGTDGRGINLFAANVSVSNAQGGLISGDGAGIFISGGGTVTNSGTVKGRATKSTGVVLEPTAGAASVSNSQGGMISGGYYGVQIYGPGRVSNLGTLTGSVAGVYMGSGTVTNQASGAISGLISGIAYGVVIYGNASAFVSNAGRIQGTAIDSSGIFLKASAASVVNASTGLITGGYNGVAIEFGSGTVTNYGRIVATSSTGVGVYMSSGTVTNFGTVTSGTNGTGVYLHSGDVTNFGTVIAPGAAGKAVVVRYGTFFNYGVIAGSVYGIEVSPGTSGANHGTVSVAGSVSGVTGIHVVPSATIGQTVTVSGTVSSTGGTGGMAVSLGGGSNRLVLQPGAKFNGIVNGGGGASVLEIAPGAGSGGGAAGLALAAAAGGATYVSLGDFTNFSVLQIDPTMVAESAGALSFATLVNQGQVNVLSGDALTFGTVAGAASVGVIDLGTAASVRFGGPVALQSILFNPAGGTAFLDHPEEFTGSVPNFAALDTLDLDLGKATFVGYAGGQLSLSYGGSIIKLAVATPYATPQFVFGGDGGVGTDVTVHDTIITGGIVLSAPASPNPYSIASGIYVTNTSAAHGGDAVYGTPGTAWTLSNAGVIKASAGGSIGVALPGGGTVINSGTITGAGGTAVRFGGGADRLVVGPGAAFIGAAGAAGIVDGGGGADEADFTVAGTDNLAGFQGFETIALAGGGANVLVMLSGNFTGVTGNRITVVGGAAGNTIRAASLPATDSVVLDGGAGNDFFVFSPTSLTASDVVAGVGGSDQLVLTGSGTLNVSGVRAVELYQLASTGANTLTLANGNFVNVTGQVITVAGGGAGNTIDASGVGAPNRVVLVGGAGADHFAGGAGNDTFKFTAASLTASDTVAGGGGTDSLSLTTSGTLTVSGVNGVETYALASTGANNLTLAGGNFAGVSGGTITVTGGAAGNTINAAALSPADSVVLDGGTGSDTFIFSAASLTASDTVAGVGGSDTLMLTTSGTLNLTGVRAVETFTLASAGANSLVLANSNFTNVTASTITINGGNAGNTINAAAVTGANRIVVHAGSGVDALTGGAGNDTFFAGGQTSMTGGAGTNQFTFAAAGSANTIAQFATSATNRIAFSNAGFALGLGGASATPQALPTALIGNLTTGAFTTAAQRFAYNQSTGQLLYDAGGGTTPLATHLVATLAGDPALTAPHLFFVT